MQGKLCLSLCNWAVENRVLMLLNRQRRELVVVPTGQELKVLADWRGFSQNRQNTCALHTNSALCCCVWLLISKAFSSQRSGNIDHNRTDFITYSGQLQWAHVTSQVLWPVGSFPLRFEPHLTCYTSKWTEQKHLQESDIYLWLCNIKESGRQLQIMLGKYLEEVWPVSCS